MPTRNVNLTDELDRFVLAKVESGRFENASEVVRAALRAFEREEQEYELLCGGPHNNSCVASDVMWRSASKGNGRSHWLFPGAT